MLGLLNLDNIATNDNNNKNIKTQTSANFYRHTEASSSSKMNKKDLLPRVKPQKLADINSNDSFQENSEQIRLSTSGPKIFQENSEQIRLSTSGPKMYKCYYFYSQS